MKFVPTQTQGGDVGKYAETTPAQLQQLITDVFNNLAKLSPDEIEEHIKSQLSVIGNTVTTKQLFNQYLTRVIGMQCGYRQPAGKNTEFDLLVTVTGDDQPVQSTDLRVKAPKSVLDFLKIPTTPERPNFKPDLETVITIQLVAYLLDENPNQYFNRILHERLVLDFDRSKFTSQRDELQLLGIYPAVAEKYFNKH